MAIVIDVHGIVIGIVSCRAVPGSGRRRDGGSRRPAAKRFETVAAKASERGIRGRVPTGRPRNKKRPRPLRQRQRRNQELLQQRQQQEVGEQHALAEDEYRKALSNLESLLQQPNPQLYQQRTMLEQQLRELEAKRNALAQQMAQMLAAESATRRQQQQNTLMPKDGSFKVFSLRHSRATDAAGVLREVLGGAATRLAVDERTNSLLVFADNETIKIVEALMLNLDERSDYAAIEKAQPGETMQLRIVWLLDIDEGMEPTEKLVTPEVVEALHELGFANPKVVCQQVTTLALSEDDGRAAALILTCLYSSSRSNGSWRGKAKSSRWPTSDLTCDLMCDSTMATANGVSSAGQFTPRWDTTP